jgi:CRISPR-associated protein Cas1
MPTLAAKPHPAKPPQWDGEAKSPLLRTLFLSQPGSYLHVKGGRLVVESEGAAPLSLPLEKVDQVTALGEGSISFAALRALLERGGSMLVCGRYGQPSAWLTAAGDSRVTLRHTQHQRQNDNAFGLRVAQNMVGGKIANSRLALRRLQRHQHYANSWPAVDKELADLQYRCASAQTLDTLRGLEGAAAKAYFAVWRQLLPPHWQPHFGSRQTQPPRDVVNALLSYGYAVLFQNLLTLVQQRGLDAHLGHLHAQRNGHPALVSDLMEEFRALVVDTVVMHLLQGETPPEPTPPEAGTAPTQSQGVNLSADMRKRLIACLEDKLNSSLTHPLTQEKGDYRRAMRTQVGHYIQVLHEECDHYQAFAPR